MSKETDFASALVREKNATIGNLLNTNAELLEALEAARDTLKAYQMDYADSGYLTAIEDVEAAIAKAKGTDSYFVGGVA